MNSSSSKAEPEDGSPRRCRRDPGHCPRFYLSHKGEERDELLTQAVVTYRQWQIVTLLTLAVFE